MGENYRPDYLGLNTENAAFLASTQAGKVALAKSVGGFSPVFEAANSGKSAPIFGPRRHPQAVELRSQAGQVEMFDPVSEPH